MIANYSSEIKIAIFRSVSKRQCAECRSIVQLRLCLAKIAHFNSVNSEIIGRKLTKFIHDVVGLLPFSILKAIISRLSNLLSNARAKSIGSSWWRLRTASRACLYSCRHARKYKKVTYDVDFGSWSKTSQFEQQTTDRRQYQKYGRPNFVNNVSEGDDVSWSRD